MQENLTPPSQTTKAQNPILDWFIRLIKGVFIGIGFILPGLSGGVLAVILGIYDRILAFLANLKKDFVKNILFFIPVGIGLIIGVFLFSIVVEKAFGKYAAQFVCLFVGFVIGTFPSLYKTASKNGRKTKDVVIMLISAVAIFALMMIGEKQLTEVAPSIFAWFGSGALIGLGLIVPGMSPSNFLIYFGLYDKMATGIKTGDWTVVIPLLLGAVICVILFAKIAAYLFKKYYGGMYHFILGMVIGSSVAIFPAIVFPAFSSEGLASSGLTFGGSLLFCLVLLVVGTIGSYLFSKVEEKYPREELF
ncbi:MAG: DUF368 domain-containing protein [Paludibacteraceae bacterium]